MHWQILGAMALAFVLGAALRGTGVTAEGSTLMSITGFVGDLFMRALKMIIVPLVFASVVVGISSIDVRNLGRLGGRTLAYYLCSTAIAVTIGLLAVNLVRPGDGVPRPACDTDADCPASYVCGDAACHPTLEPAPMSDVFLNIVPTNPLASLTETFDLLSVIFFGILFGVALALGGEGTGALRRGFVGLDTVMTRITDWVMALAPIGIFALLFDVVVETGWQLIGDLAAYMATVAGGLLLHGLVALPLLFWLFVRVNPVHLFRAMAPALLTALSTASSSATLPLTMESAERRGGVDGDVSSFVLPLGATVNMDGTALYEAVAALFIAQAFGIDLTMGQQVVIFLTATLAAIGAAGVPSAGLVTMIIVLEAVGLPLEGIAMLVAVDRVLDMLRTSVNVWGDSVGAAIIAHGEGRLDIDRLMDPRAA